MAEWIVDGEPRPGLWPLDIGRLGPQSGKQGHSLARAAEGLGSAKEESRGGGMEVGESIGAVWDALVCWVAADCCAGGLAGAGDSGSETAALMKKGDRPPDVGPMEIFFFQAEDGIRDYKVTGVQTCALPI